MPTAVGGATKEHEGKKPHKNKPTSKKYLKYKEGKKGKMCPRCLGGVFLAVHKDRLYCGRCRYTEFLSKAK